MAIKPIQTFENGPEYDPWVTTDQMERLIKVLTTSGIKKNDADKLIKLLDDVKDGNKVDTAVLRQVLGNLRTATSETKDRDKQQETQDKKQQSFWRKSSDQAQKSYQAMKSANIADALKETRDLGMIPIQSLSDAFVKVTNIVGAFAKGIFNAANSLISSLGKIGGLVGKIFGGLGKIIFGIGGIITTAAATLLGAIDAAGDMFLNLYDTGISLAQENEKGASGIGRLAQAAAGARMQLGEFAEFLAENSRITVAIGAEAMGQLSNSVRKAMYPMGQFGLSMAETNDYMAEYLDRQRLYGLLDNINRVKQTAATVAYLDQLTQLTGLTGRRRRQIASDVDEAMRIPELQGFLRGLDENIRPLVTKTTTAMNMWWTAIDPTNKDDFSRAIGKGQLVQEALFNRFRTAGMDANGALEHLQETITLARAGKIGPEIAKERLEEFRNMVVNNKHMATTIKDFIDAGVDLGNEASLLTGRFIKAGTAADRNKTKLQEMEKLFGNWGEMMKTFSLTWTNFLDKLLTDDDFKSKMAGFALELQGLFDPDGILATRIKEFAQAIAPAAIKGLKAFTTYLGTREFSSIMARIPDMFSALGTALTGALTYIRDLFFVKTDASGDMDPIDFYGEVWKLKPGSEVWDKLKTDISKLFNDSVLPIIKTSFETLGAAMVGPITNIMVGAFKGIGAALLSSAKELFMKIVRHANPMNWFSSDADANELGAEGLDDPAEPGEDDFTGFEKVAVWSGGVVIGYKLLKKGWNTIRTPTAPVANVAGSNAKLLAQQQADMKALNKPQSKWRQFTNKIKGLPKSVRGNAIMGLFLGGFVLASEIMDLGEIDETTPDAIKHREQREVAEAGGAMAGMAAGAALGSIIPGLGTAIGGIIGGLLGWWLGEKAGGALYDAILNPTAVVRDARKRATQDVHKNITHGDSSTDEQAVVTYQKKVQKNLKLQELEDKVKKYSPEGIRPHEVYYQRNLEKLEKLKKEISLAEQAEEQIVKEAIIKTVVADVVTATIAATRQPVVADIVTAAIAATRPSLIGKIDDVGEDGASDAYTAPGGIGSKSRFAELSGVGATTLESKRLLEDIKRLLETLNATQVDQTTTIKTGNDKTAFLSKKLKDAVDATGVYVK